MAPLKPPAVANPFRDCSDLFGKARTLRAFAVVLNRTLTRMP
jgi:hypothetical protein